MAYLIVGSKAAKFYDREFPRDPKDMDLFVTTDHNIPEEKYADIFRHPLLDEFVWSRSSGVATPDELYTIKLSHSYWELKNGSWNKHIFDLRWFKRRGARTIQELHDLLYKIWEQKYGTKRTNLAMEKDEFFSDAVVRIYDHDSIHDSVAYGEDALYNSILREGSTVDVDSKKLWGLSFDEQVLLFREEVCATALERIVIPKNYRVSPGAAYRWALRRTITSLTKGKSAQFILENFEEFAIPDDYVSRHLSKKDRLIKL